MTMTISTLETRDLRLTPPGADAPSVAGGRSWRSREAPRLPGLSAMESAVVEAVAYADVFDWPLTPAEIHRYLPVPGTALEVDQALILSPVVSEILSFRRGVVTLRDRENLAAVRERAEAVSRQLWPRAARFGRVLAALPFVRMVAVTGSLAVDAAGDVADVDFMVVTEDGRVWLTRAMAMGIVRAATIGGLRLCPNYLLAESALRIDDRTLFTAHELAQMVPVVPSATYDELLRQNAWYRDFLPNAQPRAARSRSAAGTAGGAMARLASPPLRSRLADRVERWEMNRKIRRLTAESRSSETRYDEARCKGHADEHGRRALAAFDARLRRLAEVI